MPSDTARPSNEASIPFSPLQDSGCGVQPNTISQLRWIHRPVMALSALTMHRHQKKRPKPQCHGPPIRVRQKLNSTTWLSVAISAIICQSDSNRLFSRQKVGWITVKQSRIVNSTPQKGSARGIPTNKTCKLPLYFCARVSGAFTEMCDENGNI
eukprot:6187709-Pleurochrysis_carterae.AAC.5